MRCSSAASRASSRRPTSSRANGSNARSSSAGPRQSAERGVELLGPLARRGAPRLSGQPLEARQVELLGSTRRTYPGGWETSSSAPIAFLSRET